MGRVAKNESKTKKARVLAFNKERKKAIDNNNLHRGRFFDKFIVNFYQHLDLNCDFVRDIRYDIVAAQKSRFVPRYLRSIYYSVYTMPHDKNRCFCLDNQGCRAKLLRHYEQIHEPLLVDDSFVVGAKAWKEIKFWVD